jgi:DHA2 family multidrug resistance protein-like MFS transporter
MSETATELGGALGIAVLGSIGAAVYRFGMANVIMNGVPPEAADAARGTLGAATAAAAWLPNGLGIELLATARDAFVQGFGMAAAISAVVVLAAAVVAAGSLRQPRSAPLVGDTLAQA